MRFRAGAFLVAARSGFPILPVAIRGSRQALPPGTYLPSPGRIEIEINTPIAAPASTDEADTSAARRAARQAILAKTSEPDLAPEDIA
jgi:1-acyl-sn-glycerol-3-phosphate acyltransferase